MQNNSNFRTWNKIKSIFIKSKLYTIKNGKGSISNYHYFVYPFKGLEAQSPEDEVFLANCVSKMLQGKIDTLVSFESDGIGITKLVSSITNIPMLICKPFHYNYGCLQFVQLTGYNKRLLYLPKKSIEDKRIAIIDIIVSTGGTINNFLAALKDQTTNTEIIGIYSVVHKHNYNGYRINPSKLFGKLKYKFLIELEIMSNRKKLKVKVEPSRYLTEIMNHSEINPTKENIYVK